MSASRQRLGQHFLTDDHVLQAIRQAIHLKCDDHCIELGAGQGALSDYLQASCARLDLIELDKRLAAMLIKRYRQHSHVNVFADDMLTFDYERLFTDKPARLVGNLPYQITSPLLFKLMAFVHCFRDMHFMVQDEVAQRLSATPHRKSYGRLSVMAQYHYNIFYLFKVDRESFCPPPQVNSAFIRLIPISDRPIKVLDEQGFSRLVELAFAKRRKTIANGLKSLVSSERLKAINIDPRLRAENLSVSQFIELSNYLRNPI